MHALTPTYRPATDADILTIVALVNRAYRDEQHRGWTTEADIVAGNRTSPDEIQLLMDTPGSTIFLMSLDTNIQGCVHLQEQGSEVYLGMLTIEPRLQNRGLGKRLLEVAEHHAREVMGAKTISMIVVKQRTELTDYYLRRGYRRNGELAPYPIERNVGQPRVEGLMMEKLVKDLVG